jgi:hypothetical protein
MGLGGAGGEKHKNSRKGQNLIGFYGQFLLKKIDEREKFL